MFVDQDAVFVLSVSDYYRFRAIQIQEMSKTQPARQYTIRTYNNTQSKHTKMLLLLF